MSTAMIFVLFSIQYLPFGMAPQSSVLRNCDFILTNQLVKDVQLELPPTIRTTKMNTSCETVFIIHGWNSVGKDERYNKIVEAYRLIEVPCYNTIRVNWRTDRDDNYPMAANATKSVARNVTAVIRELQKLNLVRKVQLVGFSLGAHIAGMVGRFLNEYPDQNGVVSKIIALDPAGPGFTDFFHTFTDLALRPTDSDVVITLSTNAGCGGTSKKLGTLNFSANDGRNQPGCGQYNCTCSHLRALEYFLESLQSNKFVGVRSDNLQSATFGLGLDKNSIAGDYIFKTSNNSSPNEE